MAQEKKTIGTPARATVTVSEVIGAACKVCGENHSILHTSGEAKWLMSTQNLLNAELTAYLPLTVVAGAPMMLAPNACPID